MTVIKGHSKKVTDLILEIRRMTGPLDIPYITHHCGNCGLVEAITVGRFK